MKKKFKNTVPNTYIGKRVDVYKNTVKKCWSVRYNGTVIGHVDNICLKDCDLIVQETGRKKVKSTKIKNVHAYIRGKIVNSNESTLRSYKRTKQNTSIVTYNPDTDKSFIYWSTAPQTYTIRNKNYSYWRPISSAKKVWFLTYKNENSPTLQQVYAKQK